MGAETEAFPFISAVATAMHFQPLVELFLTLFASVSNWPPKHHAGLSGAMGSMPQIAGSPAAYVMATVGSSRLQMSTGGLGSWPCMQEPSGSVPGAGRV